MARQQNKDLHQKHQAILSKLLKDDDNKYCVDCDAKGPRWASWNIGVFLCIRCAGIHRNLGVHISKVKSINLDSWTAEQIASVEDMGNSRARAIYEANLPDHYKRPSTSDSAMEQFIRAKYEHKKYIAKEWVPSKPRSVPAHYYDTEPPKKETKKPVKTVLTIPGAAAGTAAAASKSSVVERKPAAAKPETTTPPLMVDLSTPAAPATSANPTTTSTDLLADIFSAPAPAADSTAAGGDLFGMSTAPAPAQQSSGDASEDLFKVAEEKSQSAKDSIMALFGNTPSQQPNMMSNSFNMPPGAYGQQPQGAMPSAQPQAMFANNGMMSASYPQSQQMVPGAMPNGVGYSVAGQQPNMMVATQPGVYQQQQQGMMGMMPQQQQQQQNMMSGMQQGAFMNPQQQQQQMYAQQMQAQMANLALNQQQMAGMPKQGTTATGNTGASWGNTSAHTNGQTLNGALWN